jgi:hypothetical protein
VALAQRLLLALVYLAVHGCAAANGGAVELSWKLRPASGATSDPNIPSFLDCTIVDNSNLPIPGTHPVDLVELVWQVGAATGHSDFKCDDNHGVTGFDLPPGIATLSVLPLCGPGMPALEGTFTAPAPVERGVGEGNTISLGAVELIVQVSPCAPTTPCICQ